MTDFREEAYILEKMEITEDDEDDFQYEEIADDMEEEKEHSSDDEDLNNFEALKAKTTFKQTRGAPGESVAAYKGEAKPRAIERDVVIDDFIRNFLSRFAMGKTLNIFQQEWNDLQKKGTFHDTNIGFITDIENKNKRLKDKVEKMRGELGEAKIQAEQAKSTWEKLRKERDFHKTHQTRVNGEKVTINHNVKKIRDLHENYEERIEEIKKKLQTTVKEKALLKLEKEKLQKRCNEIQKRIKDNEDKVTRDIEESHKR
jgi:regulator of replication initiation timing